RATLTGYEKSISAHVVDSPEKSVFWEPFKKFPSTVPESEHERLRNEGRAAVTKAISGYKMFYDFFVNEYLPGARTTLGAYDLPNGKKYYRLKIREFTSLDLTPEEIHKIGLSEVDRISKEMKDVIKQVGFQGDFAAFLESLTLHEAVPGHHLQIARSRELGDLPNFRRFSYISAFGEGWGLYSEWLGLEMGFYQDPYSNFGRLGYEMWRACRLVVDTGIHAKGWTRQQAI